MTLTNIMLAVIFGAVVIEVYCVIWLARMGLWTRKDTVEMIASIMSSIGGSLLALKLLGVI